MDPKQLKGNPQVFDKLNPGLASKLVDLVKKDMERAKAEKERKQKPKR